MNRLFWCVTPGIALLFIVHPAALLLATACFSISLCLFLIGRHANSSYISTRVPYLLLLLLLFPDAYSLISTAPILWIGSAFFIIRQMMTVAKCIKSSCSIKDFVPSLLIATFFFAALPSGPVFSGLQCWNSLKEYRQPDNKEGCFRLFEGFVFLFAVTGFLDKALALIRDIETGFTGVTTAALPLLANFILFPFASFCLLYASFYGYSRMAEGSAILFGFEVPQNFKKPYLARDLGDFWQRWHCSMANFVMQYIYLPLLVTSSSVKLSLILAFIFMGLWHNLSWNFLIWAIGHGVGLAFILPWIRKKTLSPGLLRFLTLSYVIALSSIAHGSLHT
jgi:D-alanyl-lipoteichoic acid acyltransferase DltB (MBOAT superfamily)